MNGFSSSTDSIPQNVRVMALANQKGGVGKTTTAINLGTALAAVGERVIILDIDPQGNASTGLGVEEDQRAVSICDVLRREALLGQATIQTRVPGLAVVPATPDLAGLEAELSSAGDRAFRLREAIQRFQVSEASKPQEEQVSYVLIDCPPSLNILTINALAAAQSVLCPVQCEFFALEGIVQLSQSIEEVRAKLNPALYIQGVVLTMHDGRTNLSNEVASEVRNFFGDKVYNSVIPRNIRIAEAPSFGQPILLYDHKSSGAHSYIKLASEIIEREKKYTDETLRVSS